MRRPYCPTCCKSVYNLDFEGNNYEVVKSWPCGHILDRNTIEYTLEYLEDKPKEERKVHRENYYWLYNAIRGTNNP